MILHLLLSFKSLLAFYCSTFEFVLLVDQQIMFMDFLGWWECRISNLACLNQSFDATFVPKVRTAQLKGLAQLWATSGGWTLVIRVREAHKENFMPQNRGNLLWRAKSKLSDSRWKIEFLELIDTLNSACGARQIHFEGYELLITPSDRTSVTYRRLIISRQVNVQMTRLYIRRNVVIIFNGLEKSLKQGLPEISQDPASLLAWLSAAHVRS